MYSVSDNRGFTLVEILVAIVILSIGLLAMAGLTTGVIRGNALSNRMTTAIMLAQEKMEDIRRLGYAGTPTANKTTMEDYGTIANHAPYKRSIFTNVGSPAPGMKRITVTVYWGSDAHTASLTTILAE